MAATAGTARGRDRVGVRPCPSGHWLAPAEVSFRPAWRYGPVREISAGINLQVDLRALEPVFARGLRDAPAQRVRAPGPVWRAGRLQLRGRAGLRGRRREYRQRRLHDQLERGVSDLPGAAEALSAQNAYSA